MIIYFDRFKRTERCMSTEQRTTKVLLFKTAYVHAHKVLFSSARVSVDGNDLPNIACTSYMSWECRRIMPLGLLSSDLQPWSC